MRNEHEKELAQVLPFDMTGQTMETMQAVQAQKDAAEQTWHDECEKIQKRAQEQIRRATNRMVAAKNAATAPFRK